MFLCFFCNTLQAQLSKSSIAIKAYYGYSLSKFTEQNDLTIKNRNLLLWSAQISFNYLTPKHDIIEAGIGLFNLGNKINYYYNIIDSGMSVLNSNQVIGLPLTFYKNIDLRNKQFYLGLGSIFAYNFSKSVFINSYSDYIETTEHFSGLKVNITGHLRYFFKAKRRNMSLELMYSQGLINYYRTDIVSTYTLSNNTIKHKGSALQFGLTYFFGKDREGE